MAKRLYIANAPKVAQVDRLTLPQAQYLQRHIAEGSTLIATIGQKTLTAYAPYREESLTDPVGPWTAIDDSLLTKALLTDLSNKWARTTQPEFQEIKCSVPSQDDNGNWYLDFTAKIPGIPFFLDIAAPYPVVDVDTVRQGAVGANAQFSFYLDTVATGGTFRIQWPINSVVETSGPIAFPPTAVAIEAAIVAGMASVGADDVAVSGGGTASESWIIEATGALGSAEMEPPVIVTADLTGGGIVYSATLNEGGVGAVNDTFNDTDGTYLMAHTGNNGFGWADETVNFMYCTIVGNKVWVAYTTTSPGVVHSHQIFNEYAVYSDATVQVRTTGIQPDHGETAGAVSKDTTFSLFARYGSDSEKVFAEFVFDGGDYGTRNPAMGPFTTGGYPNQFYTGTITILIKKTVGGATTTVATEVVDSDMWLWQYPASTSIPDPISAVPNKEYTLSLMVDGVTVSAEVVDAAAATTTTASGSLGAYDNDVAKYGWRVETVESAASVCVDDFAIVTADGGDERQALWTNSTDGTFTATKPGGGTVTGVEAGSTLAELETKLETIYGSGGISVVSGSGTDTDPWVLRYIGANSSTNMALITGDGAGLTGFAGATVATIAAGTASVTEQWSLAIVGASGGFIVPTFRGNLPATNFAYNGNAAALATSLNSIALIDDVGDATTLDVTVTGNGTHATPFVITVGAEFLGIDVRQLVARPNNLTGSLYPVFDFDTVEASEGPWHWDHPMNWLNADTNEYGLPEDNDSLHIEMGDQLRCPKYDLDQSGLTVTSIHITGAFTNNAILGLPRWNPLGFWEYRRTELTIQMAAPNIIYIGARGGGGSPLIKFTTGATKALITIHATSSPLQGELGAVQFHGTHAENEIELLNGFLGIAPYPGQEANVVKLTQRGGIITVGNGASLVDVYRTSGTCTMDRVVVSGIQEVYQ